MEQNATFVEVLGLLRRVALAKHAGENSAVVADIDALAEKLNNEEPQPEEKQ